MKRIIILTVLLVVVLAALFISYNNKIDCNKPLEVVYLTHSELRYASEISNKINGVVVIPEDNQLIARTEILKCPSFDYSKFIQTKN